ncbi:MAG: histidinol dehydrogenase [Planctomycetaceae bacterium]|nr:histidinol dehydrogenase [Planctomycetaceae bacterium]
MTLLKIIDRGALRASLPPSIDADALAQASVIIADIRMRGWEAVLEHARRLGDIGADTTLVYERSALRGALDALSSADRGVLERAHERIGAFAEAQRRAVLPVELQVAGGRCGHSVVPVASAACYAPGGRYPLPSSVLMTATTARVAGVSTVWAASPRPTAITLAAAAISGCEALLAVGGAQAIAALATGAGPVPAVDMIVGPGNRWVTAAKWLLSREVGIDMLAGPSELLVLADATADPVVVAADLIAQAEHDADAIPMLATTDPALPARVDRELARQLATLPGAATARAALANGFAIVASSEHELVEIADALAPEHLEVMTADASALARRCSCYGAVFIGQRSAEVFGDYGIGPNHVLPTGRTARFSAGLSVLTFLKLRTWVELDEAPSSTLIGDTAALARLEGLEGHARAAEFRA